MKTLAAMNAPVAVEMYQQPARFDASVASPSSLVFHAQAQQGWQSGEENNEGGNEGDEDSKPVTKGELKALMGNAVNAAVKSQLGRVDFAKMIGEAVSKAIPAKTATEEETDEGGEQPAGKKAKVDPKTAKLERDLAEMKTKMEEAERTAAAATAATRNREGEAKLREALAGKVRPEAISLAIDALKSRGALAFDDDGVPMLKLPISASKGAKPELTELTIEDGIAEYLKTPEASVLLPAPSSGGSGARPTSRNGAPLPRVASDKPLNQLTEQDRQSIFQDRLKDIAAKNTNPLG